MLTFKTRQFASPAENLDRLIERGQMNLDYLADKLKKKNDPSILKQLQIASEKQSKLIEKRKSMQTFDKKTGASKGYMSKFKKNKTGFKGKDLHELSPEELEAYKKKIAKDGNKALKDARVAAFDNFKNTPAKTSLLDKFKGKLGNFKGKAKNAWNNYEFGNNKATYALVGTGALAAGGLGYGVYRGLYKHQVVWTDPRTGKTKSSRFKSKSSAEMKINELKSKGIRANLIK